MNIHHVKTQPKYFRASLEGRKPFEVRRKDRDYQVGNVLVLEEWSPYGGYTGRKLVYMITYVLDDPECCKEGFVVLGLERRREHGEADVRNTKGTGSGHGR